jgi:hypothetical protein
MTTKVTGDQYEKLDAKLFEIKRQIRQKGGYPYDVNTLEKSLQLLIEGKFPESAQEKKWSERDGVIHFTVVSDGKTGEAWLKHFESKKVRISRNARSIILSGYFKPTSGVVYKVAVIRGEFFSADADRIRSKIMDEAHLRKMTVPNPEVACLTRDMFTDEQIKQTGLYWIVTMHQPITDHVGGMGQLGVHASATRLGAFYGCIGGVWKRGNGFAFIAPE